MEDNFEFEIPQITSEELAEAILNATGTVALGDGVEIDDVILDAYEKSPAKDKKPLNFEKLCNFPEFKFTKEGAKFARLGKDGNFKAKVLLPKELKGKKVTVISDSIQAPFKVEGELFDKNMTKEVKIKGRVLNVISKGKGTGNITIKF